MSDGSIAVLMATYEPRLDWLREQLQSLNAQSCPGLRLYLRDDASPTVAFSEIEACVRECITAFPVFLRRSEQNLGSNASFSLLMEEAEGDYFAFCDQDDIWLPEKLSLLKSTLDETGAVMVCSDMTIIDGDGRMIADSITQIRRHHVFRSGEGLWDTLWYSNFASGCAMLVRRDAALAALPLNPHMYYDHYIALCCSARGKIVSLPDTLIRHREHGTNQSSLLQGVTDRESYVRVRVENKYHAVEWLCRHFDGPPEAMALIREGRDWLNARLRYARGDRSAAREIWRGRRFGPRASLLELALPWLPEKGLSIVLENARKNRI